MRSLICFIAVYIVAAQVSAQTIEVPSVVPEHSLVRASLTDSENTVQSVAWLVFPDDVADVDEDDDGTMQFTGPKGRYTVIATVLTKDGRIKNLRAKTTIGDPLPPPPGPGPEPEPDPTPPTPPGPVPDDAFNNLGKLVAAEAAKLPAAARAKAPAVAALHLKVAEQLEDGTIATVQQATILLQSERSAIITNHAGDWSTVLDPIRTVWSKSWSDAGPGGMTKQRVAEFYRAVASGLKGVK